MGKAVKVRYLFSLCKQSEWDVFSGAASFIVAGQLLNGFCHICEQRDKQYVVSLSCGPKIMDADLSKTTFFLS